MQATARMGLHATRLRTSQAPQGRQIVAHGDSRGIAADVKAFARVSGRQSRSSGFCRPCRGSLLFQPFSHGSRQGPHSDARRLTGFKKIAHRGVATAWTLCRGFLKAAKIHGTKAVPWRHATAAGAGIWM
jgi:hypothetical protein